MTPTLSVDADHLSDTDVSVVPETVRPDGALGAVVSGVPGPLGLAENEKLFVASPWPPCQISNPASASIR
ncbi:hypothetical protein SRB17_26480 [Streptomyces sp. RB17]|nr:hypothetical protein [Streptomyces sp. RB17]